MGNGIGIAVCRVTNPHLTGGSTPSKIMPVSRTKLLVQYTLGSSRSVK